MSDLRDRLIKASTNKMTTTLNNSILFNDKDQVKTRIPILNLALSGKFDGGLTSGLTVIAGPSKHFKSNISLVLVSAYMKKYPESMCLFYDSEFGITPAYLKSMGVDPDRVIHTPIQNVEQMKFDIVNQLEQVTRKDKVIIFVDSIGNMASKKETEDALNEKSVADMTRAKQLKSLFRIITPYFTTRDIPCVAVNHTIETIEMFSKTVMTGGTGVMYSADTVIFVGRRQVKDGTEVVGYEFILNAEKSRYVKEKSKFPLTVTFDGGIGMYSGLLELAQDVGFAIKPKNGWYQPCFLDEETGELVPDESKSWRAKESECLAFWKPLFAHQPFRDAVTNRYTLGAVKVDDDAMEEQLAQLI